MAEFILGLFLGVVWTLIFILVVLLIWVLVGD